MHSNFNHQNSIKYVGWAVKICMLSAPLKCMWFPFLHCGEQRNYGKQQQFLWECSAVDKILAISVGIAFDTKFIVCESNISHRIRKFVICYFVSLTKQNWTKINTLKKKNLWAKKSEYESFVMNFSETAFRWRLYYMCVAHFLFSTLNFAFHFNFAIDFKWLT